MSIIYKGWINPGSLDRMGSATFSVRNRTGKVKAQLIIEDRPTLTKKVYQWRYRNPFGTWVLSKCLYTEDEVHEKWNWDGAEYQKHAGPFEVPE